MQRFNTFLDENSFYSLQKEKDAFLKTDKLVINAFFFAFIGPVAFLHASKNNAKVKVYFRSDQKLQLTNITDDNNDSSLVIKLMAEKNFFKTPQTAKEITRFLVLAKSGKIDEVDENIVRGWLDQIKPDKFNLLSAVLKKEVKAFREGGALAVLGEKLRANAKVTRWKTTEFAKMSKALKVDPAKRKGKPLDVDGDKQGSNDVATPSPKASVSKPKKIVQQPWPGDSVAFVEFSTGTKAEDFKKAYKSNAKQRGELLTKYILDLGHSHSAFYGKNKQAINKEIQDFIFMTAVKASNYNTKFYDRSRWAWKSSEVYVNRIIGATEMGLFARLYPDGLPTVKLAEAMGQALGEMINVYYDFNKIRTLKDLQSVEIPKGFNHDYFDNSDTRSQAKRVLDGPSVGNEKVRWLFYYYNKNGKDKFLEFLKERKIVIEKGGKLYHASLQTDHIELSALLEIIKELYNTHDQDKITSFWATVLRQNTFFVKKPSYGASDMKIVNLDEDEATPEVLADLQKLFDSLNSDSKYNIIVNTSSAVRAANNVDVGKKWKLKFVNDQIDKMSDADFVVFHEGMIKNTGSWRGKGYDSLKDSTAKLFFKRAWKEIYSRWTVDTDDHFKSIYMNLVSSGYSSNSYKYQSHYYLYDLFISAAGGAWPDSFKKTIVDIYIKETKAYHTAQWEKIDTGYPNGWVNSNPQDGKNVMRIWMTAKQKKDLDEFFISKMEEFAKMTDDQLAGLNTTPYADKPMSKWSDMTGDHQKRVKAIWVSDTYANAVKKSLDQDFFDTLSDKELSDKFQYNPLGLLRTDEIQNKQKPLDALLKDPKIRQRYIEGDFSNIPYNHVSLTSRCKNISDDDWNVYLDNIRHGPSRRYGYTRWDKPRMIVALDDGDTGKINKREAQWLEQEIKIGDVSLNKLTNDYKEWLTSVQGVFTKYVSSDRLAAQALYQNTSKSLKRRLAQQYLSNNEFAANAILAFKDPNNPIKSFQKLTDARIRQVMKYNNVSLDETKVKDRYIRDFNTMDAYAKAHQNDQPLEDLKVDEVEMTRAEYGQLAADIHREKRNNRHGDGGLLIKRVFNVAIPKQETEQAEWIAEHPNSEVLNPMYHGTGSIAASMILRYGWAVIKTGDASVTGRMLGNGIYGATNIDKAQQYVGDSGFGRRYGTKGYIFVINAVLGEKDKDYRIGDWTVSKEWCVFKPNKQFKIYQAYEVEIVSPSTMDKILNQYPKTATEGRVLKFKKHLLEALQGGEEVEPVTTFTFVNGLIPTSRDEVVDFEDFKSPKDNISLHGGAYGPQVVVRGTEETANYIFTGPSELAANHPQLFDQYLSYLAK